MQIDRRQLLGGAGAIAGVCLTPRALQAAAANAPSLLPPAAMQSDLALLDAAYGALHPGLDRYLGRASFAARIAGCKRWAVGERSAGQWFVELARLTAAVRCGHSYPNPVNQSDAFRAAHLDGRDRVPFAFRWVGGRMVVTRPLQEGLGLRAGQVIDAIDGTPTTELLRRLLPLARADGSNDGKRVALMQVDGSGRYGSFDVYRPLLSPVRGDGTVMVRSAGRTQVLPAMTEADRKAARRGSSEREGWDFGVRGRVGVLTMPTWSMYNSKWNWRAFIDAAVDRLIDERLRGLVVDLRDNEGGEDCGDHLLKRLIDRPLPSARFRRFVRYRRAPATLTPYLDTWDKSFRDWGEAAQPSDRPGFFRLRSNDRGDDDDLIAPAGRRFTGKVAVLVSATCSSATFQFAQLVKQSGVARLIGTPTGGNQRGINGGAYFFLRLPATGTEVDLPLIGFFPDGPRPDAGITPDLVVTPTVRDIAGGRDRQMASALAWAG